MLFTITIALTTTILYTITMFLTITIMVATKSQIPIRTDSENTVFALF